MQKLWVGLIKFGFRLLYQEMAWTYDWVSWLVSLGEWRRWDFGSNAPTVVAQGTAMPAFGLLPDTQIAALIEYVKYLSMRTPSLPANHTRLVPLNQRIC